MESQGKIFPSFFHICTKMEKPGEKSACFLNEKNQLTFSSFLNTSPS
jgi:hypothetical protein